MAHDRWMSVLLIVLSVVVASAFADDKPDAAKAASGDPQGNVEVAKKSRIRIGGISLTGGYSRFSGSPYWGSPYYGYYASPYWSPFWQTYFPYGGPYPMGFYPSLGQPGPGMGEIKLYAEPKTASVYVNDAYAGTVEDLKSMWLEPGAYNLRIEGTDGASFRQRVYVLSGKTLKLNAGLTASNREVAP